MANDSNAPMLDYNDIIQRVMGVEEQLGREHGRSPVQAAHWLLYARKTYIWAVWAERQRVSEGYKRIKTQLTEAVNRLEEEWFDTLRRIDAFADSSREHGRLRSILADLSRALPTRDSLAEPHAGLLLDLLLHELRVVTRDDVAFQQRVDAATARALAGPSGGRIYKAGWQRDEGRVPEKPQQVVASASRRFKG